MHRIFTVLFTVEMGIKTVAWGFVCHDGSYLRSGWGSRLDFFIVLISWVGVVMDQMDVDMARPAFSAC